MIDKIKADIKTSLLAGDRFRVETLKLAQSSLMNAQIEKRSELNDEESIRVVQKEIKRRKEAAEMYEKANEVERAKKERNEALILEEYVPRLLSGDELASAVDKFLASHPSITFAEAMKVAIEELGAVDRGQLAGILKAKLS